MISQRRDITGGIKPRFVYQYASPYYYALVEEWEVEKNINIDMLEEIGENYLQSSEYAETHECIG